MKFFEHDIVNNIDADKRTNEWHLVEEQGTELSRTRWLVDFPMAECYGNCRVPVEPTKLEMLNEPGRKYRPGFWSSRRTRRSFRLIKTCFYFW